MVSCGLRVGKLSRRDATLVNGALIYIAFFYIGHTCIDLMTKDKLPEPGYTPVPRARACMTGCV